MRRGIQRDETWFRWGTQLRRESPKLVLRRSCQEVISINTARIWTALLLSHRPQSRDPPESSRFKMSAPHGMKNRRNLCLKSTLVVTIRLSFGRTINSSVGLK